MLAIAILLAPLFVAAAISWAAHRSGSLSIGLDQFAVSAPMSGRFFDDADSRRIGHDLAARRSRFS